MRELLLRSVSGLVYALIIVSGVYLHHYGLLALLAVIFTIGLIEFKHLVRAAQASRLFLWLKITGILLLWAHLQFLLQFQNHLATFFAAAVMGIFVHWVMSSKTQINVDELQKGLLGFVYLILPTALSLNIAFINGAWQPQILLSIFFFLWASDSFAYLTGRLIGKHKLFPNLSPKKTIEGLAGGIIGTLGVAWAISIYWHNLSLLQWLVLAAVVAVFGTIGDLFQSALKRAAGVKDSGNLIPGHGGILDRLDSFLFAVPAAYFYLYFFSY